MEFEAVNVDVRFAGWFVLGDRCLHDIGWKRRVISMRVRLVFLNLALGLGSHGVQ